MEGSVAAAKEKTIVPRNVLSLRLIFFERPGIDLVLQDDESLVCSLGFGPEMKMSMMGKIARKPARVVLRFEEPN